METNGIAERVSVYDLPEIYDIAFGYRDIASEVKVLLRWYADFAGRPAPKRIVELACGPAAHSLAFAKLGAAVVAVDRADTMCMYAQQTAAAANLSVDFICADMTDFALDMPCDLAVSMLDSVSHLTTLDQMVSHLQAVREALRPGGLYIAEMAHPGDFMTTRPRTVTRWVQRRGDTQVRIAWGADGDRFDPTTQIGLATVLLRVTSPKGIRTLLDQVEYRRWTRLEIEAAARLAGLEAAAWFGALDQHAPFDNEPGSWRMVPVLRRPRIG